MTAYFNDLRLFFQKAGAFPHRRSSCTSSRISGATWSSAPRATTRGPYPRGWRRPACQNWPACRATCRALPAPSSGSATRTRRTSCSATTSACGGPTSTSRCQNPSDATVDALAARPPRSTLAWQPTSTSAFAEFSDRDSGFYQYVYGDSGRAWWDAEDFRRSVRFLGGVSGRRGEADRDVADPAGQHEDARAEQHHRALPGQPPRVAAATIPHARTWPPIATPESSRSSLAVARAAPPAPATARTTA